MIGIQRNRPFEGPGTASECAAARPQPVMPLASAVLERIDLNNNRIHTAATRIDQVLERLLGGAPGPTTDKPSGTSIPQSAASRISEALENGTQVATWLEMIAERCERIA